MRLLRPVMLLWLLISAVISSVILYSRTPAGPSELQRLGFGSCDGKPCLMGITPGLTPLPDAMAALETRGGQCETMRQQDSFGEPRALFGW